MQINWIVGKEISAGVRIGAPEIPVEAIFLPLLTSFATLDLLHCPDIVILCINMERATRRSGVVWTVVCATLWIVTACSNNAPSTPSQKVTIATTTAPALIAFRDGVDAPWQTPVAADVGRYEIEVHGPYTVEDVCADANSVVILELARTPDDPRDLKMMCSAGPPPLSHVTGTMVQRGDVSLGTAFAYGALANWPFDLAIGDGTFDLMARTSFLGGSGDRIVIRRDLAVAGPTTVTPPIDAVKEGVLLVALPLTVTNLLPDEMVKLGAGLTTRSTLGATYFDESLPGAVRVAPDAILLPTDTQRVKVRANGDPDPRFGRSVERTLVPGGSTVFTLPPAFDSLHFAVVNDQLVATWSTVPAYDWLTLEAGRFDGTSSIEHFVEISAGYVAATGIASAVFDTDPPGYASAWHIDFTKEYGRDGTAIKDGTERATSGMGENINGPSLVPAAVSPRGASASRFRTPH
jgi:hypothetical protein